MSSSTASIRGQTVVDQCGDLLEIAVECSYPEGDEEWLDIDHGEIGGGIRRRVDEGLSEICPFRAEGWIVRGLLCFAIGTVLSIGARSPDELSVRSEAVSLEPASSWKSRLSQSVRAARAFSWSRGISADSAVAAGASRVRRCPRSSVGA